MLYDAADEPGSLSTADLRAAYEAELRTVIDEQGVDAVAADAGVDAETVSALATGESPDVTLTEAAAILAVGDASPSADVVVAEVRDHLLMGMTTGVLDVDTVASNLDDGVDLSGQEVQQAIEGRNPMTLSELAAIHRVIAVRNDR
ncbi:DUF5791 family protein [Haloplanus sp. GCM10025708]|uniref:DUF5791 family protein n=1 Tax=Haloferacaceae TaxID=1644056 RepID=UPI00361391C9